MREKEQKNKARMTSKKTNEILAISRKKAIFLQFGTFSQAKIALLKC